MPGKAPIFIASNSFDRAIVAPVAEHVQAAGHEPIIYEADKVAQGQVDLAIHISNQSGCNIVYDGQPLDIDDIGAAWLRRPSFFGPKTPGETTAFRSSIDKERRAAQSVIFDTIPDDRWLNTPQATSRAQEKLQQLILARQIGFTIPDTVVSNSWKPIDETLPEGDIAFKMFSGILHHGSSSEVTYTARVDRDELPLHATPFPGIAQEFKGKTREWRVTVVGESLFSTAIYTDPEAKDDWRKHQSSEHVRFVAEPFPEKLGQMCFKLLDAYEGLRFGAFDFTEDDNGITFLEMGPSGQYYWLETELGLPISKAIGTELVKIAT